MHQAKPAAPALPCGGNETLAGAYSPVTDPQETSSLSQDAAPVAWDAFNNKHTITGCSASTVHAVSYNVTQACKQVRLPCSHCMQAK